MSLCPYLYFKNLYELLIKPCLTFYFNEIVLIMMFFFYNNIIKYNQQNVVQKKNDGEYKIKVNKHTEHNHVKIKK